MDSPLHPAEQHSQGHLEVRAKRPCLRLGSLDANGQHHTSVLCGIAGFVHSPRPQRLYITFGSLLLEPHCGLLWIDFVSGDLLHLEARAELVWPEHYPEPPPADAERQIALMPGRWRLRKSSRPLPFGATEPSPSLPMQGS